MLFRSSNSSTALVTNTNPLGEQQKISRMSVASPTQFTIYNAGIQSISGLQPDTTYLASYWARVVTPVTGGVQLRGAGSFVNKTVRIVDEDGWIRVAGPLKTNSAGVVSLVINYEVLDAGLPSIAVDTWGVMLTEMRNNGGLPPYVPTLGSPATVPTGTPSHSRRADAPTPPSGAGPACRNCSCDPLRRSIVVLRVDSVGASAK